MTLTRATSIQSYERIKREGLLGQLHFEIYEVLFQHGPLTAGEVHQRLSGHAINTTSPRLTELRKKGVVVEVGTRVCRVTGRKVILWDVTDKLPAKVEVRKTNKNRAAEFEEALRNLVNAIPWPTEVIRDRHPDFAGAAEKAKKLLEED